METLLVARDIRKSYGQYRVLNGVSLSVREGQGFGILGPNGAGKTTLFKCLTGEVQLTAGQIVYRGTDITKTPVHLRVKQGFGRTFQVSRVFLEFTAVENVLLAVESRFAFEGLSTSRWWSSRPKTATLELAETYLNDVGLSAKRDVEAKHLSHGDRKRLELANTLALEPAVLMLDEPTAGMSPAERSAAVKLIASLREKKRLTLLLTEHDMDVMLELCDHLMVMNYGETIANGTPDEVRRDPRVREVYLGQEDIHA